MRPSRRWDVCNHCNWRHSKALSEIRTGTGQGHGVQGQKWINAMGIRPSLSNGSSQARQLIKLVNCAKKIRH